MSIYNNLLRTIPATADTINPEAYFELPNRTAAHTD